MTRADVCRRCLLRVFALLPVVAIVPVLLGQAQRNSAAQRQAPSQSKVKIRAITAFVNLDRTQYQMQIPEAMAMLKRARTIFESRAHRHPALF